MNAINRAWPADADGLFAHAAEESALVTMGRREASAKSDLTLK